MNTKNWLVLFVLALLVFGALTLLVGNNSSNARGHL